MYTIELAKCKHYCFNTSPACSNSKYTKIWVSQKLEQKWCHLLKKRLLSFQCNEKKIESGNFLQNGKLIFIKNILLGFRKKFFEAFFSKTFLVGKTTNEEISRHTMNFFSRKTIFCWKLNCHHHHLCEFVRWTSPLYISKHTINPKQQVLTRRTKPVFNRLPDWFKMTHAYRRRNFGLKNFGLAQKIRRDLSKTKLDPDFGSEAEVLFVRHKRSGDTRFWTKIVTGCHK